MSYNQLSSLQDVFTQRLFRIPDYQRGYAWGANTQLKDFWEDIIRLPAGRSHYTGMLSIKSVPETTWRKWVSEAWLIAEKKYVAYHVVDGQQRLTTFVILVQSIVDFVRSLPANLDRSDDDIDLGPYSLREVVEKYLVEQKRGDIIRTYKLGYEDDNPSFKFLKHRILGAPSPGHIEETFYTLNLENAKRFFDDNIRQFHAAYDREGLVILFEKATQRMMVNIYEIDDDFDVHAAFETMNNRGKKLSNLELLKNRLIYLSTLFSDEQLPSDDRVEVRTRINDAWKDVYYHLGRNKTHPLSDDEFLRAHWILRYQFTNKRGNDYADFLLNREFVAGNMLSTVPTRMDQIVSIEDEGETDVIDADSPEPSDNVTITTKLTPAYIAEYVDNLKEASKHWYLTYFPADCDDLSVSEKQWLHRLNRIGIAYFRPLVVACYLAPNTTESARVALFREIERFVFVAFRLSGAYSTYNQSPVNSMVRRVCQGELSIDQVATEIRERVEKWVNPSHDFNYKPFKERIERLFKDGSGFFGWGGLRYLLFEYEADLVAKHGNAQKALEYFVKGARDKVSIEHIYPQGDSDPYWQTQFRGFSTDEKSRLKGSLGNLLPLSMSVNASLQNDSFPDKKSDKRDSSGAIVRRGYSTGSHSEVEVANMYQDWDANAILERGLNLLKFMERRWDVHFASEDAMLDLLSIGFVLDKSQT